MLLSDSGFINTELFMKWLQHFKTHAKPNKEEPILLILDNHASHISVESVEFCRENGIHLLSLPPHTSHKLQPLDVAFFGPLKIAYSQEADKWMVSNPGKIIGQSEVALLFGRAYSKLASIQRAEKAFSSTGIWPYDSDIFPEEDFAPSGINDTPAPGNEHAVNNDTGSGNIEIEIDDPELLELINIASMAEAGQKSLSLLSIPGCSSNSDEIVPSSSPKPRCSNQNKIADLSPKPGCSYNQDEIAHNYSMETPTNFSTNSNEISNEIRDKPIQCKSNENLYFTPAPHDTTESDEAKNLLAEENTEKISNKEIIENICPLPKKVVKENETKRKRVGMKSEILTSTPFKEELAAKNLEREAKENKTKKQKVKKQIGKQSQAKGGKVSKKKVLVNQVSNEVSGECPACTETYTDPPEIDLVQCSKCLRWFHEICTSYEGRGQFLCDFCHEEQQN